MHYTWDGLRLFQKVETAATYALDNDKNPKHLKVLVRGQLRDAQGWEIVDLEAHMQDQAAPI